MLFELTEFTIKSVWYLMSGSYNLGYYMLYGPQLTHEQKQIQEIEMSVCSVSPKITHLEEELEEVKLKLDKVTQLLEEQQLTKN